MRVAVAKTNVYQCGLWYSVAMEKGAFTLQPILEGELLKLRPLNNSDFEALYTCASDPKIWEQHPQPERYRPEIFKKFFASAIESRGALLVGDLKTG